MEGTRTHLGDALPSSGSHRDATKLRGTDPRTARGLEPLLSDQLVCLDTTIWVAYLTPEDLHEKASSIVEAALEDESILVAPSFAWTEVGSVLRKKVRAELLQEEEAHSLFNDFQALPVEFVDTPAMRSRAWEVAQRYAFPTLYDAAFLACTELAAPDERDVTERTLWTADSRFVRGLGADCPSYVRLLV